MKFCFCRFILAAGIVVLNIVWWPASWARIVTIIAAGLLALMSMYLVCCCQQKKEACCTESAEPEKKE